MIAPKIIGAGVVGLAMWLGYQTYSDRSSQNATDTRLAAIESQLQSMRESDAAKIAEISSLLEAVQNRVGVTATDLDNAQKAAQAARKEQARIETALRKALDDQAKSVSSIREESDAKFAAVRQETTSQFGEVNGQVTTVKGDLETTRNDLAANRREMGDIRDSLGRQIAHNADELAVLKRRGERDYFEFDILKSKEMARVAGIRLQLNKADVKAKKYDITLQVDDSKLQKKGQLLNEPIQINVGKERVRYELIVNVIDKDRIRGYISTPKDASNTSAALQD
jgi:predicted negative regulator of RcsB-dependent stress response